MQSAALPRQDSETVTADARETAIQQDIVDQMVARSWKLDVLSQDDHYRH
jgi:hypothetical protein